MQNVPLNTADQSLLEDFADLLMQAGRDRAADAIYATIEERASEPLAPSMSPALLHLVYDADIDPARC